jgi:hypothetical protein
MEDGVCVRGRGGVGGGEEVEQHHVRDEDGGGHARP